MRWLEVGRRASEEPGFRARCLLISVLPIFHIKMVPRIKTTSPRIPRSETWARGHALTNGNKGKDHVTTDSLPLKF